VAVGLVLTATAVGAGTLVTRALVTAPPHTVDEAVVRLCLALLLVSTVWAWVSGFAGVLDAWRGATASPAPHNVVRRLVLAACGVAVGAALLSPAAQAHSASAPSTSAGDGPTDRLAGLPLPERATDGPRPGPDARSRLVVRTGDTLWGLAATRLPDGAPDTAVDAAWRRLYTANRARIGPDPDLVHPGLVLTDPTTQENR
jgi:nucleoid-associated protein YgaU